MPWRRWAAGPSRCPVPDGAQQSPAVRAAVCQPRQRCTRAAGPAAAKANRAAGTPPEQPGGGNGIFRSQDPGTSRQARRTHREARLRGTARKSPFLGSTEELHLYLPSPQEPLIPPSHPHKTGPEGSGTAPRRAPLSERGRPAPLRPGTQRPLCPPPRQERRPAPGTPRSYQRSPAPEGEGLRRAPDGPVTHRTWSRHTILPADRKRGSRPTARLGDCRRLPGSYKRGRLGPCLPAHWPGSGRRGRSARGSERPHDGGRAPARGRRFAPCPRPSPAPPASSARLARLDPSGGRDERRGPPASTLLGAAGGCDERRGPPGSAEGEARPGGGSVHSVRVTWPGLRRRGRAAPLRARQGKVSTVFQPFWPQAFRSRPSAATFICRGRTESTCVGAWLNEAHRRGPFACGEPFPASSRLNSWSLCVLSSVYLATRKLQIGSSLFLLG